MWHLCILNRVCIENSLSDGYSSTAFLPTWELGYSGMFTSHRNYAIFEQQQSRLNSTPSTNKLSSLIERDESPETRTVNIDALVSSPVTPNSCPPQQRFPGPPSMIRTPQTASRIAPPPSDMHPSKVHQSTQKPIPSRGPLNSHPVNGLTRSPSKIAIAVGAKQTPTKRASIAREEMTSPTFDFNFNKPESDLSVEAQKIMNGVRQEAARIKAQMMEEREKQKQVEDEAESQVAPGGRPIRKPKGKSGRYSDIHRAEFRKMDSIASHASTWKSKLQGATSSPLKRSPSKAELDDFPKSLPRVKSFKSLYFGNSERLDNTAPGKRMKKATDDDVSHARPVSQDSDSSMIQPNSPLPSAVTTPTKASLARSANVKNLKTSMIPTLTKSASTKTLRSPPKTEEGNKRLGSWSRLGGNVKSILHRAHPKFTSDLSKIAQGTQIPVPKASSALDKELPSVPGTPTVKHVNFTPSTKSRHEAALAATSPTPSKPQGEAQQMTSTPSSPSKAEDGVFYPDLAASPNVTKRAKSPKPRTPGPSQGPENFTFRADNIITFNSPSSTVNSPMSRSPLRTIRPVRPSGVPTTQGLPGAFEPAISHGISNKKRKHDADSDGEDIENVDPSLQAPDESAPKTKKARLGAASFSPLKVNATSPAKRRGTLGAASGKTPKKGGISLGRLNMLARPKERR